VVSGRNVTCPPCPLNFGSPDTFDVESTAHVVLRNLDIEEGKAGARSVNVQGVLTLDHSDLTLNAGLATVLADLGSAGTISDSTMTGNLGSGTIGVDAVDSTTLLNDTISGNGAQGLFIETGAAVTARNTIFASNGQVLTTATNCNSPVPAASNDHNLEPQ